MLYPNPKIYGNISVFENCPNLTVSAIQYSQVSGDISVHANHSKSTKESIVSYGYIECPNIYGDISAFTNNAKYLYHVLLGGTQVSGDISVFANSSVLYELDLSNTLTTGSLSNLLNKNGLRRLLVNT